MLSDGVDVDALLMNANAPDTATSSAAIKALEEIRKKNPIGRRSLSFGRVSLVAPSWDWDYNRKLGISGISVDRTTQSGGDMASVSLWITFRAFGLHLWKRDQ